MAHCYDAEIRKQRRHLLTLFRTIQSLMHHSGLQCIN